MVRLLGAPDDPCVEATSLGRVHRHGRARSVSRLARRRAAEGRVEIDLRDNIDCVPCGLNESKTCAINNTVTGLFNSIDPGVPHNAGSFRRVTVLLRENCVVGIPRFPTSCSVATTNIGDRLVNITQAAFAQLGEGYGLAEGGVGMGPGY